MMGYCKTCKMYTLKERCGRCGGKAVKPHPARFSPQDPYGEYRRRLKWEVMEKNGQL